MKRILLSILLAVVIVPAFGATRAEKLRKQLFTPRDGKVMVAVHRGDWRYAPENSIAAIKHCIDMGADIVELDLQLTKDSVLIVMHDSKLDRTTTGKGNVSDHTYAEIQKLQLKNGCGIKTKDKVPTLEEAMLVAKDQILVNLDKADTYFNLLLPVLRKTGTAGQVIMKSDREAQDVIDTFGEGLKEVIYMPKVHYNKDAKPLDKINDFATRLKSPIFEVNYYTDEILPTVKEGNKKISRKARIWHNTLWDTQCGGHDDDLALNDKDGSWGWLVKNVNCNVIQTDRAQMCLDYLRSKNLHD